MAAFTHLCASSKTPDGINGRDRPPRLLLMNSGAPYPLIRLKRVEFQCALSRHPQNARVRGHSGGLPPLGSTMKSQLLSRNFSHATSAAIRAFCRSESKVANRLL